MIEYIRRLRKEYASGQCRFICRVKIMSKKYSAVFFDFDGTIADTSKGIFNSADYAARAFGLPVPDDAGHRYFMGPPLLESFEVVMGLKGDDGVEAVKKYREYYRAGGMFELTFYPGMIELLKKLQKNGIKTAVTSSKPGMFVSQILEHYEISGLINHIACPENDGKPEKKASLITRALGYSETEAGSALMVGDRYLDMEGAVQTGVDACGAGWGYGSREELTKAGAKYIAYSTDELGKIIFGEIK